MENYIINNNLLYLNVEKNVIKINELTKKYIIHEKIIKMLDNSSIASGSSYKGRKEFVNKIFQYNYKNPIMINKNIILFTVGNIRNKNCIIINYNKIINIKKQGKYIVIYFIDNTKLELNISSFCLNNLLIKCMFLQNYLNDEKNTNFLF